MRLFEYLEYLFCPPICVFCGNMIGYVHSTLPLCEECEAKLLKESNEKCDVCDLPVSRCRCSPAALSELGCRFHVKLAYYRGGTRDKVANRLVYEMKQSSDKRFFDHLACRLKRSISDVLCLLEEEYGKDNILITYAPRSAKSYIENGTDQAKMLAEAVSRLVGIKSVNIVKRKSKANGVMKELGYDERFRQVSGTYAIRNGNQSLENKFLIVVDDVVTTGATVSEIVKQAYKNGACGFGVISVGSAKISD